MLTNRKHTERSLHVQNTMLGPSTVKARTLQREPGNSGGEALEAAEVGVPASRRNEIVLLDSQPER